MQDQELVALCRRGHMDKYALLVERHQRLVFGLALHLLRSREEAEDVAQEAFLRVYRQISQLQDDLDFLPYIKRVTSNLCMDRLRRRRTENKYLDYNQEIEIPDYQTPEQVAVRQAEQSALRQALDALPEMYREVLVMHYAGGLTYEKIAEALRQPMSIVKNRIYRGKKLLKDIYVRMEGGEPDELRGCQTSVG